jgi:hypothetical protein
MNTASFPPMRARIDPHVLRLAACLGALLAGGAAQAQFQYRAQATVDAVVVGQTTQQVVLIDPPSGGHRVDLSFVRAGREVFLSGPGVFGANIVAQAVASSEGSGNGLSASAWSSQQQLNPFQYGTSAARADTSMDFSVTVLGAPGTSGTVTLRTRAGAGVTPAPFGGTARFSSANLSATATLFSDPAGPATCSTTASCFAQRSFSLNLRDGSGLLGGFDTVWEMQITANAGDSLWVQLSASVQADNGYGVNVTLGTLWNGSPPFSLRSASGDPAGSAPAPGALASLWLSPGLTLAPTAGLVPLPDGGWGFAAPVPEPSAGWLMAGGLLVLRRIRRRAA